MRTIAEGLADLAGKVDRGEPLSRADAERVQSEPDLISIGILGESARKVASKDVVTFGRVHVVEGAQAVEGGAAADRGDAGEVRLVGLPTSADEAVRWARAAAIIAAGTPLTAFSLADLYVHLCARKLDALGALAQALTSAGVESIAEVPVDRFESAEEANAAIRAVRDTGLQVWRWTLEEAPLERRLELAIRASDMQAATSAARAFAPLPRRDPAEQPSTGYDDVRTVAMARLVCAAIPRIQVDWPLYGPKLAQVAIAFGANDIDGIAPVNVPDLGPRRAPVEDISRQIRAASADPVERNGRYEPRT